MSTETNLILTGNDLTVMYTESFSKKNATEAGVKLVESILEEGEIDEFKVWANIVRLKEVATSADKAFRDKLSLNGEQSSMGVTFTPKNGAKKLNYIEDPIYSELAEKLKSREEILKLAHNSKDVIFDSEGCEVPSVTAYFDKSSITVKY